MQVKLLNPREITTDAILYAARTCYTSHDKQDEENNNKLLRHLVTNEESPLEFLNIRFHISDISRSCSHQLVRHRMASFAQKSQRFCDETKFSAVVPPSIMENKQAGELYIKCLGSIQNTYEKLRVLGIKKEDTRFVLPNACTTELILQMNLRSLRNFWRLRTAKKAQWEIKELAKTTRKIITNINPILTIW